MTKTLLKKLKKKFRNPYWQKNARKMLLIPYSFNELRDLQRSVNIVLSPITPLHNTWKPSHGLKAASTVFAHIERYIYRGCEYADSIATVSIISHEVLCRNLCRFGGYQRQKNVYRVSSEKLGRITDTLRIKKHRYYKIVRVIESTVRLWEKLVI